MRIIWGLDNEHARWRLAKAARIFEVGEGPRERRGGGRRERSGKGGGGGSRGSIG
jgi:hypothetical protein